MKRTLSCVVFGAFVAVLGGCPIYSDGPSDYRVCDGNQCYDCPENVYSAACVPWQCSTNIDCPGGYICGEDATCVSPSSGFDGGEVDASTTCTPGECASGYTCGADNTCDLGDCTTTGCPTDYDCVLENGTAVCAQDLSSVDSGQPVPIDAGFDVSTPDSGVACQSDNDCASATDGGADGGGGSPRCLDGVCVAPPDQCYDGTQCPSGDKCVAGACTPTCSQTQACPTGFSCDVNGVCTGDPTPCESNPSVCTNGTVCSQNHCVAPCNAGANACPTNEQCVQGGCVPNEQPQFTCSTEGVQDACASGSLCLHHSCYIACNVDAANPCQSADQFNECKPVVTSSGTYDVCGSSTNLGSQCNPTSGVSCPSAGVCIDGYCH